MMDFQKSGIIIGTGRRVRFAVDEMNYNEI